uniref:Reverse transcriptase domain-containing protein n=1 Tax=Cannabis sativa TaxID=3483 RepID=A0A803NHQ3_CANSA
MPKIIDDAQITKVSSTLRWLGQMTLAVVTSLLDIGRLQILLIFWVSEPRLMVLQVLRMNGMPQVTTEVDGVLVRPLIEADAQIPLFQMHPSKSPGKDEQNAFIPGRLISYNAMIGFECLNAIKRHKKGRKGFLAYKTDVANTYDRVDWAFLKGMISNLGFHHSWIGLIMCCITTMSYAINVNGEIIGHIKPSWGLRQRDPLSTFLFLICAEGLTSLIKHEIILGSLSDISCGRRVVKVMKGFYYADGSLLDVEETKRNTFVHDHKLLPDNMVSPCALNYLWQYQDAQIGGCVTNGQSFSSSGSRSSLELIPGDVNLFVDVGLHEEDSKIGLGVVASGTTRKSFFASEFSHRQKYIYVADIVLPV